MPPVLRTADFCGVIICKRGLCRHAASVCLSVTLVHSVKTSNRILRLFSPSGSQTILLFPYQTLWRRGPPLTGASNAGGV